MIFVYLVIGLVVLGLVAVVYRVAPRRRPQRGYLDVDVPRDEWNAYQLAKLN